VFWFGGPATQDSPTKVVPIADVASERLTTLGSVVGFAAPMKSHAWLGIPFARPPQGELRWRPPARPEPWTEPLDALVYGSPCVQFASPFGGVTTQPVGSVAGDEDCLFLNLWAPRFDPSEVPSGDRRLPVMVWIHGGGNTIGHAGSFYDGSRLAVRHDLVVVSTQFRLGPMGWLAHPALLEGGAPGAPKSGNFGTLDLIAALRWVQENVEFFGGDPGNVTVFGESAGGQNVISLMTSPLAAGLFHRAIVQSGSLRSVSLASAVNYRDDASPGDPFSARELVLRLLIRDGSASDRESARFFAEGLEAAEVANFLRGKTAEEIVMAYRDEPDSWRIQLPRVIRDGVVLPERRALELFAESQAFNRVPIILGSNRDESKLFLSQDPAWVGRSLGVITRVREPDRYNLVSRLHSDLWKVRGVDEPAQALAGSSGADVFAYRFDWDEEPVRLGTDLSLLLGAAHGMEIPFLFGHFEFGDTTLSELMFDDAGEPGRRYVSDAMMSYWAEFAYAGAPGRGRDGALPEWTSWGAEDGRFLVLDTPADGGLRMSSETLSSRGIIALLGGDPLLVQAEKCELFRDLFAASVDWDESAYRGLGAGGCRSEGASAAGVD
jgi:para-nitrobenzyl esterase